MEHEPLTGDSGEAGKSCGERKAAQSQRVINQISGGEILENNANTQLGMMRAKGGERELGY